MRERKCKNFIEFHNKHVILNLGLDREKEKCVECIHIYIYSEREE